jgi:ArsR family metal-binding transcriptional regulator
MVRGIQGDTATLKPIFQKQKGAEIKTPLTVERKVEKAARAAHAVSSRVASAETIQSIGFTAVSTAGSISSKLGSLFSKAAKIVKVAGAALGYVSGASNLITGAFEGFWIAKRVSLHKSIDKKLESAQTSEEKAHAIFDAYSTYLNIDEKAIAKSMEKFERKSINRQFSKLVKEYDAASNSLGEIFARLAYRIKAAVHKLFQVEYPHRNYSQDRKDLLQSKKNSLIKLLTSGTLSKEEAKTLLKENRRALLIDLAKRANSTALSRLVSPAFNEELNAAKNNIDISNPEHQKALIDLQERVKLNHKKNVKADILESLGRVAVGALGVVSAVFFKLLPLRAALSALQVVVSARSIKRSGKAVLRLLGAEYPKTFAEDVHKIFERFKERKIVPLLDENAQDAG